MDRRLPLLQTLDTLRLRLQLTLREGLQRCDLHPWLPAGELDLQSGTQAFVDVEIDRPAHPGVSTEMTPAPTLVRLDLTLSSPLRLHRTMAALRAFIRRQQGQLDAWIAPLRQLLPAPLMALGANVAHSADTSLTLELTRLRAQRTARNQLQLRCWGVLRILGQLSVPLAGIPLPAALLHLPADLSLLLAQGSATFDRSPAPSLPGTTRLEQLLGWISSARLELDASSAQRVDVPLRLMASDGAAIDGRLNIDEPLTLKGQLQLERDAHGISLRCEHVELRHATGSAMGDGKLLVSCAPHQDNGTDSPRQLHWRWHDNAKLPAVALCVDHKHPLVCGRTRAEIGLGDVLVEGQVDAEWRDDAGWRLRPSSQLGLSGQVQHGSELQLIEGDRQTRTGLSGSLGVQLNSGQLGRCYVELRGAIGLDGEFRSQLVPIAELGLVEGLLVGQARGSLDLVLRASVAAARGFEPAFIELSGSTAKLELTSLSATLDRGRLTLPAGTTLAAALHRGGLQSDALRPCELQLSWDLLQQPCLLALTREDGLEQVVSLLTPALRQGRLTLHLSEHGRLSFSGQTHTAAAPSSNTGYGWGRPVAQDIYGERYFNALLDPASDVLHWYRILTSDDAFAHVRGALALYSPGIAELLSDTRQLLVTAREIGRRERIRHLGDLIPRDRLAKALSLLFVGTPRLTPVIAPLVQHVTRAHGLPISALKELLERELGSVANSYAVGALLNWLDLVLRPGLPIGMPTAKEEVPLPLASIHRTAIVDLPSARQIYDIARQTPLDHRAVERVCELAPLLEAEQLAYVLREAEARHWPADQLSWLRQVDRIKHRVGALSEAYGGIAHAAQAHVLGLLLPAALGPRCALGPEEIATLLKAGLATARQGRRAQLNNRLLLDLLRRREPELTRSVLVELGHQNPRALSNLLYSLLEQDQDKLAEPIDLPQLFGDKLGLEVPRQADFLAGGRRAKESYYESLDQLAEQIIASADHYLTRKQHLQQVRHPAPTTLCLAGGEAELEQQAIAAIEKADTIAAHCRFERVDKTARKRACARYEEAFARCRELLQRQERAFQLPWLRRFWARNEEALRVLSVVRAYQEDLDAVRHWLDVRSGGRRFRSEQDLLQGIVGALYYAPHDQAALLADPLVRLLLDPPAGRYNFSVISCMGVITDGARGAELEHTFARLTQRRGIRVIRTPTGTGRSLEYNAERIIEAIRDCTTPWGILGYSQGCANALLAESRLLCGTPEQQRLLAGLVCRNMLFSSANGSAHGTSGLIKFTQAMIDGERLLKHFQASYSWEAIRAVLRGLRATLDAPLFVSTLGGTHSLSFERARELHRDGQFLDRVPTSSSCAVVTEDRLPEMLEYTYHVLRELSGGAEQDTQVRLADARPTATRVSNDYTRAFARCDIGALPQATHHWAPLTHEIKIVTTERDHELAIYESPTDQLVCPWIETNARFGRIERS